VAADLTARAVLGNVRAMERAIAMGTGSGEFHVDDLLDLHRTLLEGTTEERFARIVRTEQNWIGGRGLSPADAAFVPPPPDRVPALLEDLVAFVNLDDLPAIGQAAIAHAQFETIHPFGDGNGRAGRCLIHVILRRRGVAPRYVPPVSVVLATNAREYIAGLTGFREGRTDEWIGALADSVTSATTATKRLWALIDMLLAELIVHAGSPRRDSVAQKIIPTGDNFCDRSRRSRKVLVECLGRHDQAVRSACGRLEPVMAVEGYGGLVERTDDHVSTAEIAGSDGGSGERAGQELGAESLTVKVLVERKASDQVARDSLRETACLLLAEHLRSMK